MRDHHMNGQELANKISASRSYISTILSGRVGVSDKKLQYILLKGFGLKKQEAIEQIILWKIESFLEDYPNISSNVQKYIQDVQR
jgi:hypothetical protein